MADDAASAVYADARGRAERRCVREDQCQLYPGFVGRRGLLMMDGDGSIDRY